MKHLLSLLAIVMIAAQGSFATAETNEPGFTPIFNGKDLTGWVKRGGSAQYSVEEGCIVGQCVPNTPHNSFLCTEKEWGNFILKLDFKFIEDGDSGVQFRSQWRQEKEVQRVYGYQCQLEPTGNTLGRIYDEGRRGHKCGVIWFDTFTPQSRIDDSKNNYKNGEWNTAEIQCVGPSIKTWINGHRVADIFDGETLKGFIGLQIHAGKKGTVAWKNIRIKDLGESKWEPFFVKGDDGKLQLSKAHFVLPDEWHFDNDEGILIGEHKKSENKDGLVVTDDNYTDFMTRVSYIMVGGNSALYFRAEEVNTPWLLKGFQNEIANNSKDSALWHTAGDKTPGRGWVVSNDKLVEQFRHTDTWNTTETCACGDRLVQLLNGYYTSDIVDPLCEKSGKLGLQMHGSTDCTMKFKDFEVLIITPEMRAMIERE